ncbi:hypothetical protein [Winogradskyella marincola]|uniref:Uncharacterized protein n=1 Tax=Winogradskyella marincola TaxID=3037795 RepID=A0ABT6FZ37_9FLAO|nr:hypothetical protein [Winogradskyella sp. YYF002]MDG4715063.1 hypothetical protein [Winogradskyella sp. YYF002]
MKNGKYFDILNSLPAYGEMYVPISEDNVPFYSEGFVIRFYKSDGEDWVANFQTGWTEFNYVHEFETNPNILVVAGGTCYLMNPNKKEPINVFGVGFQNYLKTESNQIVLQDLTDLTVVEPNADYWRTERISWDGIKDLKLNGKFVTGLSYDPMNSKEEWVEFIVDLENREVKGGSYRKYEFKPIGENVESVKPKKDKKSWWNFGNGKAST